jgi:Protein of unknown function (DUF3572)
MMQKPPKPAKLDHDGAETIALQALGFLASNDDRIALFLSLTGILPNDLIAEARTRHMQVAVLEHLSQDESLLLVFSAEANLQPDQVIKALMLLGGDA